MSQRYDQDLILAYVEEELDDPARSRFERQLQQDPRLQTLVQQLSEDRRQLRSVLPEPAPAGLMDRAQAFLERQMLLGAAPGPSAEQAARHRHRLVRWTAWSGVAALLLIGAGTLLFIFAETRSFQSVITRVSPPDDQPLARPQPAPAETRQRQTALSTAVRPGETKELNTPGDKISSPYAPTLAQPPADLPQADDRWSAPTRAGQPSLSTTAFAPPSRTAETAPSPATAAATQEAPPDEPLFAWPRPPWQEALDPQPLPLVPPQPPRIPWRPAPQSP